jgi:glycerol-3-phosphate dehydrogenase (NAD(P)+)
MPGTGSVAVIGAGAMGTALACHLRRRGSSVALLATERDGDVLDAWQRGEPHPRLLLPFPDVRLYPPDTWGEALPGAAVVVVAVTSAGLATVLADAAPAADPGAVWALATKGWEPETLRTPSEVAALVLGPAPVVAVSGPALAAELAVGAPTGLICAARDRTSRRVVANLLTNGTTRAVTTSDVAGVETAAAFKNVVAVAVGVAEGLASRLGQSAVVSNFGNAQAAVFAAGLLDMRRLVAACGGRTATVLGIGGAGDLFLTCQHGRSGRFGRLLGAGVSIDDALRSIGSAVEGASNASAALELAERHSIDLPSARIVDSALRQGAADEGAVARLRDVFLEALSGPQPSG